MNSPAPKKRNKNERREINRMLALNGLGTLEDPGLIPQLGFLMGNAMTTHDDFRQMLAHSEGQNRRDMYEAMKPYLKFEPKPLDVYIAEMADLAERKQLPTINPETGQYEPFFPGELGQKPAPTQSERDLAAANSILQQSEARKSLEVVCKACMKTATFTGFFKQDALDAKRSAGWRYSWHHLADFCPDHAEQAK